MLVYLSNGYRISTRFCILRGKLRFVRLTEFHVVAFVVLIVVWGGIPLSAGAVAAAAGIVLVLRQELVDQF